jgi:hypothetical protein
MPLETPDASLESGPKNEVVAEDASGCFVRVLWLASNLALVLIAALILRDDPGALSLVSAAFWAAVALAIGLHYFEVTRLRAATLSGKPATLASWRRYSLRLVVVAAGIWVLALVLA